MSQTKTDSRRERSRLSISKADLDAVCSENSLSDAQSNKIWASLQERFAGSPQFDLAHVAWYVGALVVLVAMGWIGAELTSRFGAMAALVTSAAYSAIFILGAVRLWFHQNLRVAGGLLATLAVSITPLTVAALEQVMGVPVDSTGSQFLLEATTVVAGLVALRYFKFPFLSAPISLALWFMAFTTTELLWSGSSVSMWDAHSYMSMIFGLGMIAVSFFIDKRSEEDYSFWGYIFGLAAFWIPLSTLGKGGELGEFIYFLINVGLMFVSVLLARRIFVVAGTLGLLGYIFHLSWTIFSGSILFPFALTAIGVGIIFMGIQYHRNQARVDGAILALVPDAIKRQLPDRRD